MNETHSPLDFARPPAQATRVSALDRWLERPRAWCVAAAGALVVGLAVVGLIALTLEVLPR